MVAADLSFDSMKEKFEELYPLDEVLSSHKNGNIRLEVFKYFELKRIADALETIAEKE
jgi:hypothetical protein